MLKQANLSFSVAAQSFGDDVTSIQFSTQDKNTAKLIFTIKEGKKPLDLTDAEGIVDLVMGDKSVFEDNKATITAPLDGKLEYTITADQIRHPGRARGELQLISKDGQSIGGFRFNFTIKRALVDEYAGPVKEYYVQDLEAIKAEIRKTADSIKDIDVVRIDTKLNELEQRVEEGGAGVDEQARQEIQEVTEQLAEKANKEDVARIANGTPLFANTVGEMTDKTRAYVLLTDGYIYLYNTSKTTFEKTSQQYQSAGLANESVNLDHLTFLKKSTNLFNKKTELKGKSVLTTGLLNENSPNYNVSDWIPVKPSTNYTIGGFNRIVFYNQNKQFLSVKDSAESYTVQSPSTAMYARVHYQHALKSERQLILNEGAVLLEYEPYYTEIDSSVSAKSVTETTLTIPIWFEVSGLDKTKGLISPASIRDYETKRRTGKYLNVIPASIVRADFNKGNMFVFQYDANFNFLKSTQLNKNVDMELSKSTAYIKLLVENLVTSDTVSCTLTFTSPLQYPNWIYNNRVNANNISFTYQVVSNEGREVLIPDGTERQYTTEKYYNSALLKLPRNYDPFSKPVKLIIFCSGAGGYPGFTSQSFGASYENYFQYLSDEGYAILSAYSWTTKYPDTMQPNFGSPIAMSAFVQAYRWAIENYNIDPRGVFLAGKSAGGYIGTNLSYSKGIPILATGLLAPAISPMQRPFGYDSQTKISYANDLGFTGNTEGILGIEGDVIPKTAELKEYILNNADKMIGYNPYWNGLIGMDIETLAGHAANNTEDNPDNFKNVYRISNVPTKIWVSEDDNAVSVNRIKIYLKTIKNGQGIGELRIMPDGTGGHNSVDSHENAIKVSSVTTRLGITHTNIPLAYVELLQFFRRFEN